MTDSMAFPRWRPSPAPLLVAAAAIVLVVAAVMAAHLSIGAFVVIGCGLLALFAYTASRWPRGTLLVVALAPILDRYLVSGLLPKPLETPAHFFSEALLLATGLVLLARAAQRGRVLAAFRHPTTIFLGVFLLVALGGALLSRVPPLQAIAGVVFTLDAVALFYLARMVGYTRREASIAIGIVVGLLAVAGLIALAQALLDPNMLGLSALRGRFGEPYRLASVFGDPNVFAALLSVGLPFAIYGTVNAATRRRQAAFAALAFLLAIAIWLSFSRGGWLGMLVGFVAGTALVDPRALMVGTAVIVLSFGAVTVMPRNLLVDRAGSTAAGVAPPNLIESTFNRFDTVSSGRDLRTLFITNSLPILRDHPIVGVGPGRYGGAVADLFGTPIYARYGTASLFGVASQRTVDDFWLHLLVESGIVGAAAFVAMIGAAALPMLRWARRSRGMTRIMLGGILVATAAVSVNSLTTMLLEANSVAFVFWFLLGLGSIVAARRAAEVSELGAAATTAAPPAPAASAAE